MDDDPSVILALHKLLSKFAHCRFASDGPEALEMVQQSPPNLILLDIQMPVMSGLTVCATLKADPANADIPVIFITGRMDMEMEQQVFEVGAADYIQKPLNLRVVSARVLIHLAYQKTLAALAVQAYKDGLTGINNRRRFDEQLDSEWKRAQRQKLPLSLLMVDIDEFKRFNDHFGHLEGDTALKCVALALGNSSKRPADFLARYGGEEFALILPEADVEGAKALAEIILNRVEGLRLPSAPGSGHPFVTVSIGYSTLLPAQFDASALPANALIQAADRALYQSKKNGRNCSSFVALEPGGEWAGGKMVGSGPLH